MGELKRRIRVVPVFPDNALVVRLIGAVLCEQSRTTNGLWPSGRYMARRTMGLIGKVPAQTASDVLLGLPTGAGV